jgi:uncharacterized protein
VNEINEEIIAYIEIVSDILDNRQFQKLKNFQHHRSSIYDHCLAVSYVAYLQAKKMGLDYAAVARGGLLHDFFLYDWRSDRFHFKRKTFKQSHAFRHPLIALNNAEKNFDLTPLERDIIVKHMWPATFSMPKYRESLLVCMVDKYIACSEYLLAEKERRRLAAVNDRLAAEDGKF